MATDNVHDYEEQIEFLDKKHKKVKVKMIQKIPLKDQSENVVGFTDQVSEYKTDVSELEANLRGLERTAMNLKSQIDDIQTKFIQIKNAHQAQGLPFTRDRKIREWERCQAAVQNLAQMDQLKNKLDQLKQEFDHKNNIIQLRKKNLGLNDGQDSQEGNAE